jgi:hypothetical protein
VPGYGGNRCISVVHRLLFLPKTTRKNETLEVWRMGRWLDVPINRHFVTFCMELVLAPHIAPRSNSYRAHLRLTGHSIRMNKSHTFIFSLPMSAGDIPTSARTFFRFRMQTKLYRWRHLVSPAVTLNRPSSGSVTDFHYIYRAAATLSPAPAE